MREESHFRFPPLCPVGFGVRLRGVGLRHLLPGFRVLWGWNDVSAEMEAGCGHGSFFVFRGAWLKLHALARRLSPAAGESGGVLAGAAAYPVAERDRPPKLRPLLRGFFVPLLAGSLNSTWTGVSYGFQFFRSLIYASLLSILWPLLPIHERSLEVSCRARDAKGVITDFEGLIPSCFWR